ncbi:insulin-like growth factor-binding protein 5 [Lampetra fluviatilis]
MRQRLSSVRPRQVINTAAAAASSSSPCSPNSSTRASTARSLLAMALVAACGPWSCLALGGGGAGPVVRCEPCDDRALSQCELPTGCELVREPGCGCCLTCALREGSQCGIYTERCGFGLKCLPQAGEERQLQAMLEGRGVCRHYEEVDPREESSFGDSTPTEGPEVGPPARSRHVANSNKRKKERSRLVGDNTVVSAHAQDNKHEGETGPCKRSVELAIKYLKESTNLVPKAIYIPNCDRRGYYKKKQCNPSKGRKRGLCWCVDKYGARVPGSEHMGGGARCQSLMERD